MTIAFRPSSVQSAATPLSPASHQSPDWHTVGRYIHAWLPVVPVLGLLSLSLLGLWLHQAAVSLRSIKPTIPASHPDQAPSNPLAPIEESA